ncbi:type IV secretory system conjugative DNA transfer family protein [Minwuia sp.]|uniref:type IV secretory system conjugative DNA transfer family protein n=1 Tax=Minwuia sp. TaxID=2493630 RepID=UPI003A92DB7D
MRSPDPYITLGEAHQRSGRRSFRMGLRDRLMHLYIVGQTGAGKSSLIADLARQDAQAGTGFCLLDPHGDLASELTGTIEAPHIYWDVADPACPFGYNPLTLVAEEHRPLVASSLIDTLKKQWIDAWGARMEHLLRYALLALLDQPDADLRDILPLFIDSTARERMITNITDAQVRAFWKVEFKALRYKGSTDGVAPIANKLGAFLSHALVRRAVCEPETPLRFRRIMDQGQCLIVNLATGRLGADTANVLGGLILSGFAHAGYSRATLAFADRRPFIVYADEFHAFSSSALAGMLPQLRKYGVGLVLAHQYLDQLDRSLLAAILGNAGSMMVFRVGATDAPMLANQLGDVHPRDLIGLANFECFARVMVDGAQSKPFSAFTRSRAGVTRTETAAGLGTNEHEAQ